MLLAIGGIVLFSYVNVYASVNIGGVVLSVGSAIGAALYKVSVKLTEFFKRNFCFVWFLL